MATKFEKLSVIIKDFIDQQSEDPDFFGKNPEYNYNLHNKKFTVPSNMVKDIYKATISIPEKFKSLEEKDTVLYNELLVLNNLVDCFGFSNPTVVMTAGRSFRSIYQPQIFIANDSGWSKFCEYWSISEDQIKKQVAQLFIKFGDAIIPLCWSKKNQQWISYPFSKFEGYDNIEKFTITFRTEEMEVMNGKINIVIADCRVGGSAHPDKMFSSTLATTKEDWKTKTDKVPAGNLIRALYDPIEKYDVLEDGIRGITAGGEFVARFQEQESLVYGSYPITGLKVQHREGKDGNRWTNYILKVIGPNGPVSIYLPLRSDKEIFNDIIYRYPIENDDNIIEQPISVTSLFSTEDKEIKTNKKEGVFYHVIYFMDYEIDDKSGEKVKQARLIHKQNTSNEFRQLSQSEIIKLKSTDYIGKKNITEEEKRLLSKGEIQQRMEAVEPSTDEDDDLTHDFDVSKDVPFKIPTSKKEDDVIKVSSETVKASDDIMSDDELLGTSTETSIPTDKSEEMADAGYDDIPF